MSKNIFASAKNDLPSGLVVFLVALPLCLGIAQASNPTGLDLIKPISGLIAGIVGGIVIGLISGSSLSVSGPAAGLTAVVASSVTQLGTFELFLCSTIVAGLLQVIMGACRLGVFGAYIPNTVIKGMLSAIGIILILKQFPKLVGWDKDPEGDETFIQLDGENTFTEVINSLNHISPVALLIGVLGILILIFYEKPAIKNNKIFQIIPGPLVVVILGVLINYLFLQQQNTFALDSEHLVKLDELSHPSDLISKLPVPNWSGFFNYKVWVVGLTVALVASLETLLGVEAVDKIDPEKRITPTNRELIAQGSGNMVSGLLGGLPLTSVIVRSSANVNSGAKSKASTIIHGIFLVISLLFLAKLINKIPYAALAAILIFTGYKLAKISLFKEMYKKGWDQFIPFIVTITAILFTDLLKGVIVGLVVGLFYVIRSNFRTVLAFTKEGNNYTLKLTKEVSFLSKLQVKNAIESIDDNANLIIDCTYADFIDLDIQEEIKNFMDTAKSQYNINVEVINKSDKKYLFN
jgi:MFS superfamily sulfate permease-like transporter